MYLCSGLNRCNLNFSSIFLKLNVVLVHQQQDLGKVSEMHKVFALFIVYMCYGQPSPALTGPARASCVRCLLAWWEARHRASPAAVQTRPSSRLMPTQYLHFPGIKLNTYYH